MLVCADLSSGALQQLAVELMAARNGQPLRVVRPVHAADPVR